MRKTIYRYMTAFIWFTAEFVQAGSAPKLAIIRKASQEFKIVDNEIRSQIGNEFQTLTYEFTQDFTITQFRTFFKRQNPAYVVVMDNLGVEYTQEVMKTHKAVGVATMALNLKSSLSGDPFLAGIAYEIPLFNTVTAFRNLVTVAIRHVLVLYRKDSFAAIIEDAKKQLKREKITLHALDLGQNTSKDQVYAFIDKNLTSSRNNVRFDAILVLSDNILINNTTFSSLWVPRARKMKIPFLCGIKNFALEAMNFCTFATSPILEDLGRQTAELLLELKSGENPQDLGVDYLWSFEETINVKKLAELNIKMHPKHE